MKSSPIRSLIILLNLLFIPFAVYAQEEFQSQIIQVNNIDQLSRQSILGHGVYNEASWSANNNLLMTAGSRGVELYDTRDFDRQPQTIAFENREWKYTFNSESQRVIISDLENNIQVWDLVTNDMIYKSNGAEVNSAILSPDGTLLAIAYTGEPFAVIDLATNNNIFELETGTPIQFTPDNRRLIIHTTIASQALTQIVDIEGKRIAQTYQRNGNSVYSHDGHLMGIRIDDPVDGGRLEIWSLRTGEKVAELAGYQSGQMVVSISDAKDIMPMEFSDDNSMLAFVTYNANTSDFPNEVNIWHFENDQTVTTLEGYSSYVRSLNFSPDGSLLATAEDYSFETMQTNIRIWNSITGELQGISDGFNSKQTYKVSFNPAGTQVLSVHDDGIVRIWNANTVELLTTIGNGYVNTLFSLDGRQLITSNALNEIQVWSITLDTYNEIAALRPGIDTVQYMALNNDGDQLAFTTGESWGNEGINTVQLWNINTNTVDVLFSGYDERLGPLAFSSDGTLLAVIVDQGTYLPFEDKHALIQLWNTATHALIGELVGHQDFISSLAFSPDSQTLASGACGGRDIEGICNIGEIILWDVTTSKIRLGPLHEHTSAIYALSFNPNGDILASGSGGPIFYGASGDYSIVLWNTTTGHPILPPFLSSLKQNSRFHDRGQILSLAFSPNGNLLASGNGDSNFGFDSTIRIWSTSTGRELAILDNCSIPIQSVVFLPDGTSILSASKDGLIRIWSIP